MYRRTEEHESRWRGQEFKRLLSLCLMSLLVPAIATLSTGVPTAFSATPNDPSFSLQWSDDNTGQNVPSQESEEILGAPTPGTPADDDGALKAWQLSTGSRSIVIGETDTGVEYTHPDLAANIWSNPGTIGGCATATHGYNVLAKNCNPMDTDTAYGGHGTHVAGIMGAVGNNGIGVTGINWQTTILPVKWLNDASTESSTSVLIEALQWLVAAKQAGVNIRVINDSATFPGTAYSQALSEEIDVLGANDILFVTAAGNTGQNDDELVNRRYPCGYDRPNEICVTASNDDDQLPSWANYGPTTVDLAAPGVSIYSTLREGKYGYLSGGSMAAAQVSGAAALILSVKPNLSATELKADILEHVDPIPALSGRVITSGILDICKALPGCEPTAPGPPAPEPPTSTEPPSSNTPSQLPASADGPSQPSATSTASGATAGTMTALSTLTIASTSLRTEHGRTEIRLRCTGSEKCSGRSILTVKIKRDSGKTRVLTIGTTAFSIPAGKVATVTVTLDTTGRTLLSIAHGYLRADLRISKNSPAAPATQVKSVHLVRRKQPV